MAIERAWDAIGPVAFIANGGADGTVTVSSVAGFKVKQSVVVSATTLPDQILQVKKVISSTKLIVGPTTTSGNLMARQDMSAYGPSNLATIQAEEQKKSLLPITDIVQAVYEQEPTVAIRTVAVDSLGNHWGPNNPLPVVSGGENLPYTDDIKIIRDSDSDPIRYEFYLGATMKYFITVTYDSNKNASDYQTTVI